ncbi:hypothetical protein K1719_045849 [Acacia pycnantha]|nr:hypothetical protein K1719_045849 [Acacia pycnantha]
MASSSSSAPSSQPQKKYDVFISFSGADTGPTFTSHLLDAIRINHIEAYIDEGLEKGDEIWSSLEKAIQDSTLFLIIFSENYASSTWCLEELTKILECSKNQGRLIMPVFYRVYPSHVRNQSGSYQEAFEGHEHRINNKQRLQKWKEALTHAANLSGWHCSFDRDDEAKLIQEIVKDIIQKLGPIYQSEDYLKDVVAIQKRMRDVESLLHKGSNNDVQFIGIWGMGGVSKTTLAKALFHKMRFAYEGSCFLANVREESEKHGIDALRKKLVLKLLGGKESHVGMLDAIDPNAMSGLRQKEVFLVLDDVD